MDGRLPQNAADVEDDESSNDLSMPLLEEHLNGADNKVQEEEDLEVSSHDLSMPPLEGMNSERNVYNNKATSNMQVMNEGPVVSEKVEVEEVLSKESDGESSNNLAMPPLEDEASFPVVNATPNNMGPMIDSLVANAFAISIHCRRWLSVAPSLWRQ